MKLLKEVTAKLNYADACQEDLKLLKMCSVYRSDDDNRSYESSSEEHGDIEIGHIASQDISSAEIHTDTKTPSDKAV